MSSRGPIVFAPSRYGENISGGAEVVQRELAIGLSARGWEVEVATTCAVDHHTWANVLPPGEGELDGLPVRRFEAVAPFPEHAVHEAELLAGHRLSRTDQYRWLNTGMRSPELYHYLLDTHTRFRGMVFTPYPTWLAVAGSQIAAKRSVLWTCLHDEAYAYLDVFKPMFNGVAGLLLQSQPEVDFLHRVTSSPAPHALVGCTVPIAARYDEEGFRTRHGIEGPFVLYAGRREGAKGWDDLLAMFESAVRRFDLPFTLVTMGGGDIDVSSTIADRVIDLGFLPDDERDNAFAAATAYLQPSRYEAFSRTIMEAWLAGTPVIANGRSAVLRWHCERSGAGFVYDDVYEFEQCLAYVHENAAQSRTIAAKGREYVLDNYSPDDVIDRIDAALDDWLREKWDT